MFQADWELDRMIGAAVEARASDIHFDAGKDGMIIRFRIDGSLVVRETIATAAAEQVINRIKVCSGMDISKKRVPQDGRWQWHDRLMLRVSSLPSLYGETVVCRILGRDSCYKTLPELGMSAPILERIQQLLQAPYGLILVCGPTGSGKTSTLYALLRMLDLVHENVISLENPVEASIAGVVQVPVNPKAGLTFAAGLRAVLRQDPDTILVGEIRDKETAELAVRAALTGHRVFSTIHTNTALGVIERLKDMGVDEYLVKATLLGALSQRLVRRCGVDGYEGRMALYELWQRPTGPVDWSAPEQYLAQTLAEAARIAIDDGFTTAEEVRRCGLSTH